MHESKSKQERKVTAMDSYEALAASYDELTEKVRESILANAKLYLEKSEEYRAHAAKQA